MASSDNQISPLVDIPKEFYDFVSGKPISQCICCGDELLDSGRDYMIEKSVKGSDVLIEYAVCFVCAKRKHAEMSVSTLNKLDAYFAEMVDHEARVYHLYHRHRGFDFEGWIGNCLLSGQRRDKLEQYVLVGAFKGRNMVMGMMPYMISPEASQEVGEMYSAKTKDELENFVNENFGLPPEFEELFRKRELLLI